MLADRASETKLNRILQEALQRLTNCLEVAIGSVGVPDICLTKYFGKKIVYLCLVLGPLLITNNLVETVCKSRCR